MTSLFGQEMKHRSCLHGWKPSIHVFKILGYFSEPAYLVVSLSPGHDIYSHSPVPCTEAEMQEWIEEHLNTPPE